MLICEVCGLEASERFGEGTMCYHCYRRRATNILMVNALNRRALQEILESRGFAVYDHEDIDALREAVILDLEVD